MEELQNKKEQLEQTVNNSLWDNSTHGFTYKFQNGIDLWINGNAHFTYEIVIENHRLKLKFFPNGKDFFIERRSGEKLYLQDDKQQFELQFRERTK